MNNSYISAMMKAEVAMEMVVIRILQYQWDIFSQAKDNAKEQAKKSRTLEGIPMVQ